MFMYELNIYTVDLLLTKLYYFYSGMQLDMLCAINCDWTLEGGVGGKPEAGYMHLPIRLFGAYVSPKSVS